MTLHEEIATIRSRIAKAESQRDAWRAAGREEKYLAAYYAVEALELQLEERLRAEEIARPASFVDTEASWRLP